MISTNLAIKLIQLFAQSEIAYLRWVMFVPLPCMLPTTKHPFTYTIFYSDNWVW